MFSFNKRTETEKAADAAKAAAAAAAKRAEYNARPNVAVARRIKDSETRFGELNTEWWQIRGDVLKTGVVDKALETQIFDYLRKLNPDDQRIIDMILNNVLIFNNQRVVAAYLKTANNLKLHVNRDMLNKALQTPGIDDQVKKVITFFIEQREPFDPDHTNADFEDMSFLNDDEEEEEEEEDSHVPIVREVPAAAECGDKQVDEKLVALIQQYTNTPLTSEVKSKTPALYRALVCIKAVNCPEGLVEVINKKGRLIYLDEEDNVARGEIKVTPPTPEQGGGRRRVNTQRRKRNLNRAKSTAKYRT